MAQEFTIKSQQIEDKINQLLPSQGGFQPGVDFSASTMVIPIVDLTETAEGSSLRQDLQSSLSLTSVTAHNVSNTTSTLVDTTGYFRLFGNVRFGSGTTGVCSFQLTDGTTTKTFTSFSAVSGNADNQNIDIIVFLAAGESLLCNVNNATLSFIGATRQIADINGNLVNP